MSDFSWLCAPREGQEGSRLLERLWWVSAAWGLAAETRLPRLCPLLLPSRIFPMLLLLCQGEIAVYLIQL